MKISMAGEIAAAGAFGSTEMLMWGGALELAPLAMARVMADEGAEIGKKVTQWANM